MTDNTIVSGSAPSPFPIRDAWVYLNHAAIGPMPATVEAAGQEYLRANSRSGEHHWMQTGALMETLRTRLAGWINVTPDDIAFTRNVSEGISLLAYGLDWREGDNVVLPDLEFPANVYPWLLLQRQKVQTRLAAPQNGAVTLESLASHVDDRTRVISVSSVQFFNGYLADLATIGQFCRERGIIFCVDCIQHLGALPLDMDACGIDFLACGGHKWLMAGEGIGFVAVRKALAERLAPANVGWQGMVHWTDFFDRRIDFKPGARRFETGTCSAMGLYTISAALDVFAGVGVPEVARRVRERARQVLDAALRRNFEPVTVDREQLSGIVSFRIPGQDAAAVTTTLKERGVQVASRQGVIRVSPHFYNTREEIDRLFAHLDEIVG